MPFHLFVFFTSSSSESLKWEHVRCDVFEGQCYKGSRTETPVRGWVKVFPWSGLIEVSPGVRRRPRQRNIWWSLPVAPPSTYCHQVDNRFAISQNSRIFHLCCCPPSSLHVPVLEFHFFSLPHRCPSPCPPPPPPSRPCSSSSSPSGCWLVSSGILTRQWYRMIMISSPHSLGASNNSTGR